jgi:hypothetical protein
MFYPTPQCRRSSYSLDGLQPIQSPPPVPPQDYMKVQVHMTLPLYTSISIVGFHSPPEHKLLAESIHLHHLSQNWHSVNSLGTVE